LFVDKLERENTMKTYLNAAAVLAAVAILAVASSSVLAQQTIPAPSGSPSQLTPRAPVTTGQQPRAANPANPTYVEPPVHNSNPIPRDPHDDR
jgi:hypothetical protein